MYGGRAPKGELCNKVCIQIIIIAIKYIGHHARLKEKKRTFISLSSIELCLREISLVVLYSAANDPRPQMIPRPEMIPKLDRK